MRTVNLIQFTNPADFEGAYEPAMNQFYKVDDLEDTYYYDAEDDEGDTYEEAIDAIGIFVSNTRIRHVVNDDETKYNLLTIVLDDDSQLFRR